MTLGAHYDEEAKKTSGAVTRDIDGWVQATCDVVTGNLLYTARTSYAVSIAVVPGGCPKSEVR